MLTWNDPQPTPTLPAAQKKAPAGWAEANVADQIKSHAPHRANASFKLGSAAMSPVLPDAKAFATPRATATPDSRAMHCARAFARAMLKGDMALARAYQRALWRVAQNPARFSTLAEGCA